MRVILALALATALSSCVVMDRDHAAHHRGDASMQMASMRQMHDRMMAARTPQERQALMAEHMKAMQDGMAMMGRMRGGPPGAGAPMGPEMMSQRLDMMEMMMQMMMDREAARQPAPQ